MIDYAMTALQQLVGGMTNATGVLSVMIGGKHFAKDDSEMSVSFKFTARSNYNYCKIVLDGDDTYTVILQKYVWSRCQVTKESKQTGLYANMLKSHFESESGLVLSL